MRYAPRVKETTTTTSTGTYSLAGAVTGFQTFVAGISDTEETWYCCTDGTDWEIGIGTVTDASPDTLARTQVVNSSNSNNAVDWGAGDKDIFCIFPPRLLGAIDGDWYNTVIGSNSIIRDNDNYAGIAIGQSNTVSGVQNIAIGYSHSIATDSVIVIALGNGCGMVDDSGNPALIYSSGPLANTGDSQLILKTFSIETTDATETGLGYFVLSGSTSNTGTALYEISVVARQTGGTGGTVGDSKSWKLDCMVTFASGVLTQVGTTVSSVIGASTGTSAWTCAIDVSDNATGPIRVTGEANETIQWVAFIRCLENSTGITT